MGTLTVGPRITHQFDAPKMAVNGSRKNSICVGKNSPGQQQRQQLQELKTILAEMAALSAEIDRLKQQAANWVDYETGKPAVNVQTGPAEWIDYETGKPVIQVNESDSAWEAYE